MCSSEASSEDSSGDAHAEKGPPEASLLFSEALEPESGTSKNSRTSAPQNPKSLELKLVKT